MKNDTEKVKQRRFSRPMHLYYAILFVAVAILESLPRFTHELFGSMMVMQRIVLLGVFFFVAWFFTVTMHDEFRWSVLSSMFFIDAGVTAILAILLAFQPAGVGVVYATMAIIGARAALFSYLASRRLEHMRGLVFIACLILLIIGEIVISVGELPHF